MNLRLRPLRLDDEAAYQAAQAELAVDDFPFGFMEPGTTFAEHVQRTIDHRYGRGLPPGFVESSFLVADVGGSIVGRSSIRHVLNDELAHHGGHIGYAVRPGFRRRGYATEILRQSLVIIRSYGVERVLVTCNDDNVASAAVIEACGGVLERVVAPTGPGDRVAFRRYWIA